MKYSDSIPEINIKIYLAGDKIHLEISDFGIGIAQQERKKIFEKLL